eukprot:11536974-Alexandrium_andersonii.AAC.1
MALRGATWPSREPASTLALGLSTLAVAILSWARGPPAGLQGLLLVGWSSRGCDFRRRSRLLAHRRRRGNCT